MPHKMMMKPLAQLAGQETNVKENARLPPRNLNNEFNNVADSVFTTPIAAMTEETLRLMQMPQNPEMERVIHLTKNAAEQLERQNPLSSLHDTQSRVTATVIPEASRTPGGHHRQQQPEHQNQRNQEDQEVASIHRPRGGQPAANQAPGPQPNRNNNRDQNREEVADSIMDTRDMINARRRPQPTDNSDRFLALSSIFNNVEYPKDFKLMNI
jgi:hypothetical protein